MNKNIEEVCKKAINDFNKIGRFAVRPDSQMPIYPCCSGSFVEYVDVKNLVNKIIKDVENLQLNEKSEDLKNNSDTIYFMDC